MAWIFLVQENQSSTYVLDITDKIERKVAFSDRLFWKTFIKLFCLKRCIWGMRSSFNNTNLEENFVTEISLNGFRDILGSTRKRILRIWNDEKWADS